VKNDNFAEILHDFMIKQIDNHIKIRKNSSNITENKKLKFFLIFFEKGVDKSICLCYNS